MKIEAPTNNFLKPMFHELDEAWNIGFNVKYILTNKVEVFRITLICACFANPACREIFGFPSK